jgi:hypothetical protein
MYIKPTMYIWRERERDIHSIMKLGPDNKSQAIFYKATRTPPTNPNEALPSGHPGQDAGRVGKVEHPQGGHNSICQHILDMHETTQKQLVSCNPCKKTRSR